MRDKLKNMDSETMAFSTINMNSFSDAPSLQGTLEQPLEKKSGTSAMLLFSHAVMCTGYWLSLTNCTLSVHRCYF